ncbi:MAG: metal-sulfur cluster assembly factor [Planctomycetota bacterium]|nr:metal-sulfur cluster assembly factor [Planctomycetota bacterium]
MAITEEQVREALKQVIDPELFINIIDLGLVYTVTVAPAAPAEPAPSEAAPAPASEPAAGETAEGETSKEPGDLEDIFIDMTMTSPACPAGPQLIGNSRQVLQAIPGVSKVEIKIVMSPPWTPDLMTEDAKDQLGIF